MRRIFFLLVVAWGLTLALVVPGCNSDGSGTSPQPEPCSLSIQAPAVGDDFVSGDPVNIRWRQQGDSPTVMIELVQAGATVGVISAATENDGFFPWNAAVLGGEGGEFLIRITVAGKPDCKAESGTFTIVNTNACAMNFTMPLPADTILVAGQDLQITWDSHDTMGQVHIDLMNGHLLESLVGVIAEDSPDDGSFIWNVDSFNFSAHRDNVDDSVYWLRIYDEGVPTCADSTADFNLIDTDLCLIDDYITPFSDVLTAGDQVTVGINFHDPDPGDMIKIRLYAGNVLVPGGYITPPGQDIPAASSSYTWTVQDYGFTSGGSFFNVRVIKTDDPYCWGKTDNFAIQN